MGAYPGQSTEETGLKLIYAKEHRGEIVSVQPFYYDAALLRAVYSAQKAIGEPVYIAEVHEYLKKESYYIFKLFAFSRMGMFNLYATDRVLANKELTKYSINPDDQCRPDNPTEYMLYSDHLATKA